MDQNGTIVYRARMLGGTVTAVDDRAYFLGRASGDLQMVVRAGDQAPGLPAGTLLRTATSSAGLGNPVRISPFGEILYFQSSLYDLAGAGAGTPTTADTALFWGPVGGLIPIAREGDPVPFLGTGETYGPFLGFSTQNNAINGIGEVLFSCQLLGGVTTTANDGVMVAGLPGGLAIVYREGETLGTGEVCVPASGATQMSFINQLNQAGQVLHQMNFSTTLGTPPATTANDRALAIWTPGPGRTIIAREGQQAPGLPAGVLFATPSNGWAVNQGNASFTRSGNTAISSPLDGGGTVVGVDDNAIYYGGVSGLTLVMRKGDPCPGLGGGETFGFVGNSSLTCNDGGKVAFVGGLVGASVTAANDTGIWVGGPGSLTMLAREGDAVPGFPGYTYENINTGTNNPLLSDRGVLVQLSITNGTSQNVLFGFLDEPTGWRQQVVLDFAVDSFTTGLGTGNITGLSSSAGFNGGDGGQSMFNNSGDFCYRPSLSSPLGSCILRGHIGSMICEPSSVPVTGGVPHNFHIDAGPSQAFRFYVVLATSLGTRPGFFGPFGPQNIPLNPDALWTTLSLDAANSIVWINSIGVTDAAGKGVGPAGFVMPPGYPGFLGTTLHHAAAILDFTLTQTLVTEPSAVKLF